MIIPKLRRLPVTHEDVKDLNLVIPHDLLHHAYERQFDHEEYRLLKLGLIEEEIAYIADGWLYYFARRQPYQFDYKLRLVENSQGAKVTELWADSRLDHKFIFGGTTEHALNRAIRDIRIREHPATLDLYKKRPELMEQSNTHPMTDVELPKQDFWKLIWGFIRRSMDDHWMSWFDFDIQTLNIHWYWTPYHLYQIRFEEFNAGYRATEVKIAANMESTSFNPAHAKGMINFFVRNYRYRIEEV